MAIKGGEIKIKNSGMAKNKPDYILLAAAIFLALFGLVMVYSASNYSAFKDYGDSFLYVKKQLPGFVLGLALLFFLWFYPYQKLQKFRYIFLGLTTVLLILVFIPGVGIENYGSRRWVGFMGFTIQPSELAKFSFILFSAYYMSRYKDKLGSFIMLLPVLAAGSAFCLLIILEPNMSITVCMGLLMLGMLYIGGCKKRHFAAMLLPAIALIPILILIEPYRLNRLYAFIDPWQSPKGEGYQLIQSLYALGGGGFFGVGLFNSRQKLDFLPFSESDFIFSIVGEELGLFGCVLLIAVFAVFILRGIKTAVNATSLFGCYLASGIVMIVAIQVLINIAVVTGSIPPTGLPLPFISYGGSSLMVFMGASGVLLNISMRK
jgi:cell division protein FtsW